jgi:hypothetical protein
MKLLGAWVMWILISVRLEIVLLSVRLDIVVILTQDSCMFCAKCTTGLEIVLDPLMKLLGDVGHVESHFGPFGDSVSVGAR